MKKTKKVTKKNQTDSLVKGGIILVVLLVLFSVFQTPKAHACGFFEPCDTPSSTEAKTAQSAIDRINSTIPIPQLSTSLERANVAKRAELFNKPDKISYIYLISYGKVMAYYTVKGKVSSLRSYMVPTQRLISDAGNPCTHINSGDGDAGCYVVDAPDIDGTYGDNVSGIFFFTTEGAYVEWKGDYFMSDQSLRMTTPPELVREVK